MRYKSISFVYRVIVYIIRFIKGSDKCPEFIEQRSKKLYGRSDNLRRYWYEKYKNLRIGKYTYGYEFIEHKMLRSVGAFTSIASGSVIVPNDHKMEWVTTSPILALKEFDFVGRNINMEYCPVKIEKLL